MYLGIKGDVTILSLRNIACGFKKQARVDTWAVVLFLKGMWVLDPPLKPFKHPAPVGSE